MDTQATLGDKVLALVAQPPEAAFTPSPRPRDAAERAIVEIRRDDAIPTTRERARQMPADAARGTRHQHDTR